MGVRFLRRVASGAEREHRGADAGGQARVICEFARLQRGEVYRITCDAAWQLIAAGQ